MKQRCMKKNSGLTLVELLIAMTLGLFLIGGVIQVFLGTKQTYSVVTSQSYAQESGRFALFFLSGGLKHAGYWGTLGKARMFQAHEDFPTENAIVFGVDNDSTNADIVDGTDHLYIRMTGDADGSISTCLGTALLDTQVAIDHYYIATPDGSENIPSLFCASEIYDFDVGNSTIGDTPVDTDGQSLVNGIESLQALYGIVGAGGDSAERYVNASDVGDWRDVRSVRLAVLATSNDDSSGLNNTTNYSLLDESYNAGATGDRRARTVFEQTISLRNFIFKSTSS